MSQTNGSTEFLSIGKPLLRKEDRRLLTGNGRYLDDIQMAGELHVCFVRSPYPHARIGAIDMEAALAAPGVVSVVTGKDLSEWTTTARMAPPIEGLQPIEMTALPIDKALFAGDPVACVVATDRYLAEDASLLVEVDYEPLEPVTDMFKAMEQGSPLVDDNMGTNLISHQS